MLCCRLEGLSWLWEAAEQHQQGGQISHLSEQTAFALGTIVFHQHISQFLIFHMPTTLLRLASANF